MNPFNSFLDWHYKYRNCENCPASCAGYESHDFDSCAIYGDDFRYVRCVYNFLPRCIVKRMADKHWKREADAWAAYADEMWEAQNETTNLP